VAAAAGHATPVCKGLARYDQKHTKETQHWHLLNKKMIDIIVYNFNNQLNT
jgi:hypothetical protein